MFKIVIFVLLSSQSAYAKNFTAKATYLKNVINPAKTVQTCWLNPEADRYIRMESGMKITENIIKSEYLRAGIEVLGWRPCSETKNASSATVLIIEDRWPQVSEIGCTDKTKPWCIRMNFDYVEWPGLDTVCQNVSWERAWACNCHQEEFTKTCIQNYALHEFGHSLGLAHEADHSKSTCDDKTGTLGAEEPFDYNSLSIMDYCQNKNQIINKLTPMLSELDILTLLEIQKSGE